MKDEFDCFVERMEKLAEVHDKYFNRMFAVFHELGFNNVSIQRIEHIWLNIGWRRKGDNYISDVLRDVESNEYKYFKMMVEDMIDINENEVDDCVKRINGVRLRCGKK